MRMGGGGRQKGPSIVYALALGVSMFRLSTTDDSIFCLEEKKKQVHSLEDKGINVQDKTYRRAKQERKRLIPIHRVLFQKSIT